ncbi:MAG: error-prone DNA polymerase [Rhodoferax sp.]|nr:error-prone DNA polymerase [Rhodoferax sp.]
MWTPLPAYAELHCLSSFSFQRGASLPEELVARAAALGYSALAITDECSVAGVVRAHTQAKESGLKLLLGAEFRVTGAAGSLAVTLVVLSHNLQGWGNLCEFITAARGKAAKGAYEVSWQGSGLASLQHCEVLLAPARAITFEALCAACLHAKALFGERFWLALELLHGLDDDLWTHKLEQASAHTGVPLVAAGNVHMHVRSRKPLQDVLTAVRLGKPVAECGFELQPNAEAHLRARLRLAGIYASELLQATLTIASRCTFSLDELRYQYPVETVLPGLTPSETLRRFTYEGMSQRYPQGIPAGVQLQVEHELDLIAELRYEMYFLTVYDIVRFARERHILCQGRGSAANSAVCYCLGVTEVDPARMSMLFERFISRERNEPPDIDVDFEHQRREEVIQYIYAKYGRDRAAITGVVVTYRPKSAIRDVGKALGLDESLIDAFAREHRWFDGHSLLAQQLQERVAAAGMDPDDPRIAQWLDLTQQLMGHPRHLSQHVGGFVLTQGKLTRLVPVENAAMPDRSVIQWEKDDLDAMGLLKVDVLALGMLSAIRRCLDLIGAQRGTTFQMQDIPAEDPATYDMICAADTVGVFQIESRAQMSMLPRLLPRCFYDLVIEVAIVRPGPIQGGMVHPYLRRRQGLEPVEYPGEGLRAALERTLGVPIFQEQVMQIAMLAAGFSAGESDSLRRSMAAWKRKGGVHKFHDRMVSGMVERGYTQAFAESIFKQIEGFGEYGFPESHAASFALLVYVSCWLKHHEPVCFLAAMLNSQPLGFYSPSQLVQDAQRHGVPVRAVDVMCSDWDCTMEEPDAPTMPAPADTRQVHRDHAPVSGTQLRAVRLGLRMVAGLASAAAQRIVHARADAPFTSTEDLALRGGLDQGDLKALASADALISLSGHRRQQVWDASALRSAPGLLKAAPVEEDFLELPAAWEGEEVEFDYAATGLTLRSHPLALLREELANKKLLTAAQLRDLPNGRLVRACGIVVMRQQPQTAKGVVFVTLEDETGSVNVIVWKSLREKQRSVLLHARLMAVYGVWQRDVESGGEVRHLIAQRLEDLTPLLGGLATRSREFH